MQLHLFLFFLLQLQQATKTKREWKLGSFKEFTNEAGLRALFAEFLGTFMLVLFATGDTLECNRCCSISTSRLPVFDAAVGRGINN